MDTLPQPGAPAADEGVRGGLARMGSAAGYLLAAFAMFLFARSHASLVCGSSRPIHRLQLAATAERAGAAIAACEIEAVRRAVVLDYAFVAMYVAVLASGAVWVATRGYRVSRLRRAGPAMAKLAVIGGAFDAFENGVVLAALRDGGGESWLYSVAAVLAWGKFMILAAVAAYVAIGLTGSVVMPAWARSVYEDRGPTSTAVPGDDPRRWETGIAVSGGGIRSASFALGGLQALDDTPLGFDRATRVSAVSGGAYMIGAWSIARLGPGSAADAWSASEPAGRGDHDLSPEEAHLRRHLDYLARVDDNRPAPALVVGLGALWNGLVLLAGLWLLARPFGWLVQADFIDPTLRLAYNHPDRVTTIGYHQWMPPLVWTAAGASAAVLWVVAVRLLRRRTGSAARRFEAGLSRVLKTATYGSLGLAATLTGLLVMMPAAMIEIPARVLSLGPDHDPVGGAVVLSVLTGSGVAVAVLAAIRNRYTARILRLGGVLLGVMAVLVGGWIATHAAIEGVEATFGTWSAVAAVFGLLYLVLNPDWWSLAPYYRARLRTAYALRRVTDASGSATATHWPGRTEPRLWEVASKPMRPEFCGAVQVRGTDVPTHAGIPALDLTMTADAVTIHLPDVGGNDPRELRCAPRQLAALMASNGNPRVTTMFAVAVSGAAVAPSMGRMSQGPARALLAFANIRTGVWIPNPRWARHVAVEPEPDRAGDVASPPSYPRLRLSYLVKEIFGVHDIDDLYQYATDGGHWENTAITQLLRTAAVDEMVAFDAGRSDPQSTLGLAEAVSMVTLELGTSIDIDIGSRRPSPTGVGSEPEPTAVRVGLIRHRRGRVGLIWYTRPEVTADHSAVIQAFADRDEVFPADSTINQLFDVERYEAYRRLGYENGAAIGRARAGLVAAMRASPNLEAFRAGTSAGPRSRAGFAVDEVAQRLRTEAEYQALRAGLLSVATGTDPNDVGCG